MSDNRREALEALRDDINAGKPFTVGMYMGAFPKGYSLAYKADRGSLDAARALHEEVLPEWDWSLHGGCQAILRKGSADYDDEVVVEGLHQVSARAWLLSILSALISETPKGETP